MSGRGDYFVLIPSYNSGGRLAQTVKAAREAWPDVWVVIDGSTDGSDAALPAQAGLRVIRRARNGGKGAAVLEGLLAADGSFTHVLVMDADGQHPAEHIRAFIAASRQRPEAMILGQPVFPADAPRLRVLGRRLSNALAHWETGLPIGDALFGFRIYPAAPLLEVMRASRHMRGYDFDTEALVRLAWRGVPPVLRPAPVRYFSTAQGGISHFRYGRDNLRLAGMHARLLCEAHRRA